jgi:hypothetical protein
MVFPSADGEGATTASSASMILSYPNLEKIKQISATAADFAA